jgi:trk system potassium uptake protein TrkA
LRIIVVGCGRMGAHLAQVLAGQRHDVCVVDDDPDAFDRLGSDFPGRIVIGTGIDEEVLADAGAAEAETALVAVTNNDATNFMVGQVARHLFGIRRIGVRINDPELEALVVDAGFAAINPPALVARHIGALLETGAQGV